MTLFDLLFLLSAVFVMCAVVGIVYQLARRRWGAAAAIARWSGVYVAVYFAALVTVSLATPQKVLRMGEERCFDEWCITVLGAGREAKIGDVAAQGVFEIVTVKVSSHSRGRRQSEPGAHTALVDATGRKFEVSPAGEQALERLGQAGQPITGFVEPGASFQSVQVYDVTADAAGLGFLKDGNGPGNLIIGDSASFLHRPTIVRLP